MWAWQISINRFFLQNHCINIFLVANKTDLYHNTSKKHCQNRWNSNWMKLSFLIISSKLTEENCVRFQPGIKKMASSKTKKFWFVHLSADHYYCITPQKIITTLVIQDSVDKYKKYNCFINIFPSNVPQYTSTYSKRMLTSDY